MDNTRLPYAKQARAKQIFIRIYTQSIYVAHFESVG